MERIVYGIGEVHDWAPRLDNAMAAFASITAKMSPDTEESGLLAKRAHTFRASADGTSRQIMKRNLAARRILDYIQPEVVFVERGSDGLRAAGYGGSVVQMDPYVPAMAEYQKGVEKSTARVYELAGGLREISDILRTSVSEEEIEECKALSVAIATEAFRELTECQKTLPPSEERELVWTDVIDKNWRKNAVVWVGAAHLRSDALPSRLMERGIETRVLHSDSME
ncbi:MAG: hypothetical protein HYS81_03370 [Candidatus Aenigmatarchaeota archaeon]|nr:MAG: hypothetical protein HYS81_03370 [Candidatus Aenigmarchaeota archaeon]